MAAVTADAPPAMDPGLRGPVLGLRGAVPARTSGPAAADRSPAAVQPGRTVRSWPLLVLAAPAAAEVWSGWVAIAQKTGFGLVSPLPGIWPSLHLDTAITLPVGVEAYAAYALRAWLPSEHTVSTRTRRFAKWSAMFSLARRSVDAATGGGPCGRAAARSPGWSPADRHAGRPDQDQAAGTTARTRHPPGTSEPLAEHGSAAPSSTRHPAPDPAHPQKQQALRIALELADAGRPVSRRALRSGGIKGSNEALNTLARMIKAELLNEGTILP
jgi:hypothetical protein